MDALSDVLKNINLKSSVYFREDFASPWGMEMVESPFAQFHMVVNGKCWLTSPLLSEPKLLSGGDIVLFIYGDPHSLSDEVNSKKVPGQKVVEAHLAGKKIFKSEGNSTTLVCGHFELNRESGHPLINELPRFIQIFGNKSYELNWMELVTSVIIQETDSGKPGSDVVSEKLAEVLFIQILRNYLLKNHPAKGFLAALNDYKISNALSLIHKHPNGNWTLGKIARNIGMSRSAFAAKFKALVGLTPMEYITSWRMQVARKLLENKRFSMQYIAEEVGYTSEAAFSRAFKRLYAKNPGALRKTFL